MTRMHYCDFYDLKAHVTATINNKSVDSSGQTVNWRKVRSLMYQCASSPTNTVAFRYNLQEEYRHIQLTMPSKTHSGTVTARKSTRRHKSLLTEPIAPDRLPQTTTGLTAALKPKYKAPIPISKAKKKDLIDLCKAKVIDTDYHTWYEALPVCDGGIDRLPLPNADEDSQF